MTSSLTLYVCECGNESFKIQKERMEKGLFINTKIVAYCISCGKGTLIKEINEEIH